MLFGNWIREIRLGFNWETKHTNAIKLLPRVRFSALLFDTDQANYFAILIGVLCWPIEWGQIDIYDDVA